MHAIVEILVLRSRAVSASRSANSRDSNRINIQRFQQCERAQTHRRRLLSLSKELHASGHRVCGNGAPHARLRNLHFNGLRKLVHSLRELAESPWQRRFAPQCRV